jgi:hypothetical protein
MAIVAILLYAQYFLITFAGLVKSLATSQTPQKIAMRYLYAN